MELIGRDCWNLIAECGLTDKDLLSLRATCHYMNGIVKGMNELWFRAHQWFLIKHGGSRKVKSAVKKHVYSQTVVEHCIPYNHPALKDTGYHNRYSLKQQMIQTGKFTLDDCKQNYHWKHIVPKERDDIPHKGYNKKNKYIYYYLIECYRYKSNKKRVDANTARRTMDRLEHYVREYNEAKRELKKQEKLFSDNDIFNGVVINSYEGV